MSESRSNLNMNGNVFQEAGFESVDSLPADGNFEGREVLYNGEKYIFSKGAYVRVITNSTMALFDTIKISDAQLKQSFEDWVMKYNVPYDKVVDEKGKIIGYTVDILTAVAVLAVNF